ncbi:MAG TPA: glycosyltransferase family 9 protein [Bacteroidota bacterium]|nr:glycosyltransferase family 9 protein [Bacteroidota bacterium]
MNNTPDSGIQRILVIKLRAIGDVLLSTPVLENLRAHYPAAVIDVLTEKFAADVIRLNPFINSVIAFDRKTESSLSLIRRVRQGRYTIVFDLFCNPRTALLTFLSGARTRVGFPFRFRGYAYNKKVTARRSEVHNVDFNLDALRALSIPVATRLPLFPLDPEAVRFAEEWFAQLPNRNAVGINAGGGWVTKRWRVEHFAELADRVLDELHVSIVLFWGPGEEADALALQRLMKHPAMLLPKTTLQQSAACIKQCSYFISNDSGPMHIGAALGVPTLGIYGPTNPFVQGPFGTKSEWVRNEALSCLCCNLTECPIGNVCMTELSAETVYRAFERLIEKNTITQ